MAISSLWPGGLPACAPAMPALSSWARFPQPVAVVLLVQLSPPTPGPLQPKDDHDVDVFGDQSMPLVISFPTDTMLTGVPCAAKDEMTCCVYDCTFAVRPSRVVGQPAGMHCLPGSAQKSE